MADRPVPGAERGPEQHLEHGVVCTGYGHAATATLARWIREAQGADRLTPVTVVVPSNLAGVVARFAIGEVGGLANVTFLTALGLAERLARARLATAARPALTDAALLAAIRVELADAPGFFAPVASHASTGRALARRLVELSRARPETRARLAAEGSSRTRALVDLHDRVRRRLDAVADEGAVAEEALAALAAGDPASDALGTVIVHLVAPLPPGLAAVVRAVLAARPGGVVVACTGDALADAPVLRAAERLGITVEPPAGIEPEVGTEIISASDVDEEVRAVVRRVLALAGAGIRLDRMAVLVPAGEPYLRTVAAQLAAAGLPANGPDVRTLADTVGGRLLDRVLALVDARFARDELVDLLASVPIRTVDGRSVPVDRWDRVSRRAGVVDGDDWHERLTRHAAELEQQAADRAAAGVGGEDRVRREAEAARALLAFVADLRSRLAGLAAARGWAQLVDRAEAVLDELLDRTGAAAWPETEVDAMTSVRAALTRAAALDVIEPDPAFATFAAVVTSDLRAPLGRTGRHGEGIAFGPITSGVGLDLDAVFVLGLAEGRFPIARREDALLADADRALAVDGELGTRESALAEQLRAYRAALASASEHRVLSFARGDLRTAREQVPSRLLLETASALAGRRIFASELGGLGETVGVDAVPSFAAGLDRLDEAPGTVERDVGDLTRFVAHGGDVAAHPLIGPSPAGQGVEATRARASSAFTRWDGNVSAVADVVPSPASGELVSATRLETWSECPMRYFLGHVLRVPVEQEPERLLELSPLDRGTLVHLVLEEFVGEELARPAGQQVPAGAPWPPEAFARIRAIAGAHAAEAEARGLTGKSVLWELHREAIEMDLEQFLLADSAARVETGAVPVSVEFPFGFDDAPPVTVTAPDGTEVRFRGRADRVDRRPDGTFVVLDYKTGRPPSPPDGCEDDPTWAGTRLQLPLYAAAARARLGAEEVEAAYWYVSERGGFTRDELVLDEATDARFREVVGRIVAAIDAGIFPADPGEPSWFHDTAANCAYCDYDELCPVGRVAQFDAKVDAPELAHLHELAPDAAR